MTDFPTSDRRAATKALHEAESAWRAHVQENAVGWSQRLKEACGDSTIVAAILTLHEPEVTEYGSKAVACSECFDHDDAYYDRGAASWPCNTIRAVMEHAPERADVPTLPPYPTWDDFYREPDVTFTLAHHTKVGDDHLTPGAEVTLPLSQAKTYRYRMTHESWVAVEKASRA